MPSLAELGEISKALPWGKGKKAAEAAAAAGRRVPKGTPPPAPGMQRYKDIQGAAAYTRNFEAGRAATASRAAKDFKGANQARAVEDRKHMESLRPQAKVQDWRPSMGKWGRTGNGATGGHVRYQ